MNIKTPKGTSQATAMAGLFVVATIYLTGASAHSADLTVNSGTITIDSISDFSSIYVATALGDTGTLNVTTSGILNGTAGLIVGQNGTGLFNVSGGSVSNTSGIIGQNSGSNGTATLSNGIWDNKGYLYIAYNAAATGTININGGSISNVRGVIGLLGGSYGTATVSDGQWTNEDFYVGFNGTGILDVTGGRVFSRNGAIGIGSTSFGTATVSSGTWHHSGNLAVGSTGPGAVTGTLTMSGGLMIVGGNLTRNTRGALNLNVGGTLQIGTGGTTGTLLGGSGDLTNNGTLIFNRSDASTYSGALSGLGAIVKQGAGTLTLFGNSSYTGGTTLTTGTLALGHANAIGSSGRISFGGGTLQASASNTSDYSARFSNAPGQHYSVDTNGQTVTLSSNLTSSGGSFTKLGAGTVTLSGNNTYTGTTTVSAGTLELSGTAGSLTATSAVNISGGTLLMSGSAANRINNTASISLGGDTDSHLQLSGAVTETMGDLTLSFGAGARVIDFGSTSGVLTFASLWADSPGPVHIWNWSGFIGTGGGTDQLFITSGMLEGSLALSDISFYSGSGTGLYSGATIFTSNNELVPVPEASTLLGVLGLMAPLAWRERRHWMRCREARR